MQLLEPLDEIAAIDRVLQRALCKLALAQIAEMQQQIVDCIGAVDVAAGKALQFTRHGVDGVGVEQLAIIGGAQ